MTLWLSFLPRPLPLSFTSLQKYTPSPGALGGRNRHLGGSSDLPETLWAELCQVHVMWESQTSVTLHDFSPFHPDSRGFATPVSHLSTPAFGKDRGKELNILLCVVSWEFSCPLSSRQFFSLVFLLHPHRASQHSSCVCWLLLFFCPALSFYICKYSRYCFTCFLPKLTQFPFCQLVTEQLHIGMVWPNAVNTIHLWYYHKVFFNAFLLRFFCFFFHKNLLIKLTLRPLSYFMVLPPSHPKSIYHFTAISELTLTNSLCLQLFDMECNTCLLGLSSISEDTECNFLKRRIKDSKLPTATYEL